MSNSILKDSTETEKKYQPKSTREITGGKVIKLHKYWKGIAARFIDKAQRRMYLNSMLDATIAEHDSKMNARKNKKDLIDKE